MSSLLSIPREIRDSIIELALSSSREPYPSITAAEPTRSTKIVPHRPFFKSWSYGRKHVLFESHSYLSNSLPLLLVNHQLSSETTSTISRLSKNASLPHYSLDVMFVNELELWPTWLSVPTVAAHLDRVNVTIRAVGVDPTEQNQWKVKDGMPPQLIWCFYYLLEHVLRHGPLPDTYSPADKDVSIKLLHLDVVGRESGSCGNDHCGCFPGVGAGRGKEWCPAFLARYLRMYIGRLARMGYHEAQYGGILYERVGEIRISVMGEEMLPRVHFGDSLAELKYVDPRNTFGHVWPRAKRVPAFEEWKRSAWRRREERGLPAASERGREEVGSGEGESES
ncbi:hypothetical protein BU16DRAFT_235568 [Lophium mytilinum]|uniref:F-box domain-containing protein n=1 Tax=Lophium mytilinum TaxID=390894 RepID=A0A6A6R9D8_9PEZI|nr:hypothetical protein BU16DRAFT_235568 [Lophium mytilinum]